MSRLAVVLLMAACGAASPSPSPAPAPHQPTPPLALRPSHEVVFAGACDASGAVALDDRHMVVADDEDNVLRIYDATRGGAPIAAVDVSVDLGLTPKGKRTPRMPELDLEAATRLGERAYWITSHGRNSKGKARPERLRFFATTLPSQGGAAAVEVVGSTDGLLGALLADPRFARFELAAAAARAPKSEGGFNLEGMTATPDGALLLGFRNPVPAGRALLVRLEQPAAFVAGGPATLGPPIELDLGGLGVRALSWWRGQYLIVAGARDGEAASRLFTWDGHGAAVPVELDLAGQNPEGTFSPDDGDQVLLLSDDGAVAIDGTPCKELPDATGRRFRGLWLAPTAG